MASSSSSTTSSFSSRTVDDSGIFGALLMMSRTRRSRTSLSGGSFWLAMLTVIGASNQPWVPHHQWNRSCSRRPTSGGTIEDTSPPNRATSRTRLDARNECSGVVGMKRVSMPDNL